MEPMLLALACLSVNVYHEARGEPDEGQLAVAYVTLRPRAGDTDEVPDYSGCPSRGCWRS